MSPESSPRRINASLMRYSWLSHSISTRSDGVGMVISQSKIFRAIGMPSRHLRAGPFQFGGFDRVFVDCDLLQEGVRIVAELVARRNVAPEMQACDDAVATDGLREQIQ